jgi:hypothetical protein
MSAVTIVSTAYGETRLCRQNLRASYGARLEVSMAEIVKMAEFRTLMVDKRNSVSRKLRALAVLLTICGDRLDRETAEGIGNIIDDIADELQHDTDA